MKTKMPLRRFLLSGVMAITALVFTFLPKRSKRYLFEDTISDFKGGKIHRKLYTECDFRKEWNAAVEKCRGDGRFIKVLVVREKLPETAKRDFDLVFEPLNHLIDDIFVETNPKV